MESVLWAFKQLHDKGLAYEGFRVLPYCWNDETPLSNHELRMDDDVYKLRQDQSVTVTFPLVGEKAEVLGLTGVRALAWTTTPWTLPTNAALAVGPEIEYAVVPSGPAGTTDSEAPDSTGATPAASSTEVFGEYLLATARVGDYAKELGYASADEARAAVTRTVVGRELDGRAVRPALGLLRRTRLGHARTPGSILVADYVSTEEGTGIVHQAPAYGEDDQVRLRRRRHPGDHLAWTTGARFLPMFAETDLPASPACTVFEANKPLIRAAARRRAGCCSERVLRAQLPALLAVPQPADLQGGVELVRAGHRVPRPHGRAEPADQLGARQRQGRPVRQVAGRRARLVDQPQPLLGHARSRCGRATTPRYPRIDVYGSLDELERDFGRLPRNADGEVDLHRPYIDELTRPNPDDPIGPSHHAPHRGRARRLVRLRLDAVRPGALPVRERATGSTSHSPADFIVEYIGQTRGWFYLLHMLSTALFDRPAFTNVVSHGIVLGNDGQKMSKSLRNYPDVSEVFDRDGSDAMRWFLLVEPGAPRRQPDRDRGGHPRGRAAGAAAAVEHLLLLHALRRAPRTTTRSGAPTPRIVLDRYLLAKTGDLVRGVTADLDGFDTPRARPTPARLRRRADQLVRAAQPRPVLGRRSADRSDGTTRSTPSTPCSRR